MASTNDSKLEITELDFDGIAASLRNFLKSQTEFSDYDFDESGLSVLINLLAYNTHYGAFYQNQVANEIFIDSASLRQSIVSRAKLLGYTPRSVKSSNAIVNIRVNPDDDPSVVNINKWTKFSAAIDGQIFTFVNENAITIQPDADDNFIATNVLLTEGIPYSFRYTVDYSSPNQRFIIPNSQVDTNSIVVRVQVSSSNIKQDVYQKANDLNNLTDKSLVYFLQENEDGNYEVYFGDNVIGKNLDDGNIVIIDYLLSSGELSNKATGFTPQETVGGYSSATVTTVTPAYGGADRETIEQIRFAAPKNFEAQNRAVTVSDYKFLLNQDYPNIDSISVWGGEDNDPPIYGKVFMSIKPKSGFVLTENTKERIKTDILKKRNVVSILPEIVNPEYIFVLINSSVKYDATITDKSPDQIKAIAISTINNFGSIEIDKFDRVLKYSKLVAAIDNSDVSITNNLTSLRMKKSMAPHLNVKSSYSIKFYNSIEPKTLTSDPFICSQDPLIRYTSGDIHKFSDDGLGNISIYKTVGTNILGVRTNAGTIDYVTGEIIITDFIPSRLGPDGTTINFTVKPVLNDIQPVRNNIIALNPNDITVDVSVSTVVNT